MAAIGADAFRRVSSSMMSMEPHPCVPGRQRLKKRQTP